MLTGIPLDVSSSDLLVECYCPLSLSLTLAHPPFYSSGRMVIHPTAPVSTSTPLLIGSRSDRDACKLFGLPSWAWPHWYT